MTLQQVSVLSLRSSLQQVPSSSASASPDDRSATFQPVAGGPETHNGTVLLVEAYAAIWIVLMVWLFFLWRKQRALHDRLDEVERSLTRAESHAAAERKAP